MFEIINKNLIRLGLLLTEISVKIFCLLSFIQIFTDWQFGRQSELFDLLFDFALSFSWLLMFETLKFIKLIVK